MTSERRDEGIRELQEENTRLRAELNRYKMLLDELKTLIKELLERHGYHGDS